MTTAQIIMLIFSIIFLLFALIDVIATIHFVKRWQKRLQNYSETLLQQSAEIHNLELQKDFWESKSKKLQTELENSAEKLKKAHEKIAVLMVEYNRLNNK